MEHDKTGTSRVTDPAPDAESPSLVRMSFVKRTLSSGALRFAGWWSIFAGLLAMNSVCPICGAASCPVGIGATGIIAGLIAAVKQWGWKFIKTAFRIFRPHNNIIPECVISSALSGQCHQHQPAIKKTEVEED